MHLTTRNVGRKRLVLVGLTPAQRLVARTQRLPGKNACWNWTGYCSRGYGRMTVAKKGILVHRLAYEVSIGRIPNGLDVLHTCDNPRCVRPSHLFVGNDADNMKDKTSKGRQARGQTHGNSKLTDEQRVEIKRKYRITSRGGRGKLGMATVLARKFGVTAACVRMIANGVRSNHLQV